MKENPTQPISNAAHDDPRNRPTQQVPSTNMPIKRRTPPNIAALRRKLRPILLSRIDEADNWQRDNPEHGKIISERLQIYIQRANITLSPADQEVLRWALLDDLLGYGPITSLARDSAISEIMVNGPDVVFIEHDGELTETNVTFDDNEHVNWVAQRIARRLDRTIDRANPMTDARLPDGSRVHLLVPPAALLGTMITIRKFPEHPLTMPDLIKWGTLTPEAADFLAACVRAKLSIVVSGGMGSGKTTLLNILSSFIPSDERIVTVEDAAELQIQQRHVVRLETLPAAPGHTDDTGQLTTRDLVKGSLRMRPDRLVIGECRGGEAFDMLQAMNTGQEGLMTTLHANTARDAISRLETLTMMSGMELPLLVIRRQIASAVNIIVQQNRLHNGRRKVVQISEVQGLEGDTITLQELFSLSGDKLQSTGFRSKFMSRLEENGYQSPLKPQEARVGKV